jgi:hypothetical protein
LVCVNKTWEELTKEEKTDLNCPEAKRVNRRRRKTSAKKLFLFNDAHRDFFRIKAMT